MSDNTSDNTVVRSSADHPVVDVRSWKQATTAEQRTRAGLEARGRVPLSSHAKWQVRANRRGVIGLLEEQSHQRVQSLIPLRYYRKSASSFTF